MKNRRCRITITPEGNVARWVRKEAARRDTSVSRLLGSILKQEMGEKDDYSRAMVEALARDPFLNSDGLLSNPRGCS
jgi:hypothetical protein